MQKEHKKCTTSLMIWPQKLAQQTAQQTAQLTTRKRTKKTQRLGLKSTTSLIIFAQQQATEKITTSNLLFLFGTDHNFIDKKSTKSAQLPWWFDHKN